MAESAQRLRHLVGIATLFCLKIRNGNDVCCSMNANEREGSLAASSLKICSRVREWRCGASAATRDRQPPTTADSSIVSRLHIAESACAYAERVPVRQRGNVHGQAAKHLPRPALVSSPLA